MKKKSTASTASFPVSPTLQKLTLVSMAALTLLPLCTMLYYTVFSHGGISLAGSWGYLAVQLVQFVAPVVYFLLCLWILPRRASGILGWFFHASLVAFIAYCFVMVVGQVVQTLIFSLMNNGNYSNNFWTTYGAFSVPQALGAIVLVICLWKGRKGGLGRG